MDFQRFWRIVAITLRDSCGAVLLMLRHLKWEPAAGFRHPGIPVAPQQHPERCRVAGLLRVDWRDPLFLVHDPDYGILGRMDRWMSRTCAISSSSSSRLRINWAVP